MQRFTADMVKPLRDRIGCSQQELADEIAKITGTSCGVISVSHWERGKVKKISHTKRQALIEIYNSVGGSDA